MSTIRVNTINDASGGNTAVLYGVAAPTNSMGFRNRIINGDMRIDQRNAGASVTPINTQYLVDRFSYLATQASKFSAQQNAGSVTPPAGFSNYQGLIVIATQSLGASDFFGISQKVEGFNIADLGWGAAGAQSVTLSFWARSSLTGTFGGSLRNSAGSRSYPFSYTISAANTWEQKTVTIAGDITGTWLTNSGIGIDLFFSLGSGSTFSGTAGSWSGSNLLSATGATSVVGTNGATFYLTGVQLEAGSVASPFERRDYGRELMMCQRYYYKQIPPIANQAFGNGYSTSSTAFNCLVQFPVTMRINPTALETSGTASHYAQESPTGAAILSSVPTFYRATYNTAVVNCATTGLTTGQGVMLRNDSTSAYLAWSAEL